VENQIKLDRHTSIPCENQIKLDRHTSIPGKNKNKNWLEYTRGKWKWNRNKTIILI